MLFVAEGRALRSQGFSWGVMTWRAGELFGDRGDIGIVSDS